MRPTAVVADRRRRDAGADALLCGTFIDRRVSAATESALAETDLFQDGEDGFNMPALGSVRGTEHRKLRLGYTETLDPATQDRRHDLERFGRGAKEHRLRHVAHGDRERPDRIGNCDCASVETPDKTTTLDGNKRDIAAKGVIWNVE
jgi:hypothetical protein